MITLYSNDCPKCKILKLKLKDKNIEYNLCSDIDTMISKGFQAMPKLEVNEAIMDFADAINWVKEQ
jgi:hypothetical protein